MADNIRISDAPSELRRRAEASVRTSEGLGRPSFRDDPVALHELLVHQIELEMQNEELRRAQEALEAARARYFDLYDLAPVGYCTLTPQGVVMEANLTAANLLGIARGELAMQPLTRFIHPYDQDVFYHHRRRLIEADGSQSCELRMMGQVPFWARFESTVVHDAHGASVFRVVLSDITVRKRTEQSLQQFKTIFDTAQFGALIASMDGTLMYVNDSYAAAHGWAAEDLVRRPLSCLHNQEQQEAIGRLLQQLGTRGRFDLQEVGHCRKDGTVFPMLMAGMVVRDAAGSPQCLTATAIDITERKQLETQLLHAQKMEAVGTMASGIAHDFNNILAGLMGRLSLLELELGDSAIRLPAIREMQAQVERGANLTRQMLGFARRGKYDIRPLVLATVIERVGAMFGGARKDIIRRIDLESDLPAVLMDEAQCEQVLMNLFINAGHAMPDGGILSLRATGTTLGQDEVGPHGAIPGRFIKLAVEDTGIGMDAATQARIFDPFFTTKAPGQGTGLGLASVYGILKNHGGFIQVVSAPGKGAAFTLFMPATEHAVVVAQIPLIPLQQGKGTILIVDDEQQILDIFSSLLELMGYQVLTASGGKDAVALVRRHGTAIALVLLDMTMPGMNGSQTFDAIRAIIPGIKVLLSSGYSVEGQAQAIMERGCSGFIQKPFNAASLSAKLRDILGDEGIPPSTPGG